MLVLTHLSKASFLWAIEACIWVLGIQDLSFYFQGYRILSILFPGIWDTVSNIFVTFRDIEYLGKLIMWTFAILPVYFNGYLVPHVQAST